MEPLASVAWEGVGVALYQHQQVCTAEHHHPESQLLMPLVRQSLQGRWRPAGRPVDLRVTCEEVGVVSPEQPHSFAWAEGAQVVSFFLHPERLAVLSGESGAGRGLRSIPSACQRDPVLRELLRASGEALRDGLPPARLEMEALATVVGLRLLRLDGQRRRASLQAVGLATWQLRRVTDFVEANLDGPLGLEALAGVVGLSPSHFARSFKRATGSTPHRFVLTRRLERARELLVTSALPLGDVAQATGFCSQSHFTALFRARHGATPARFRRERRA
ncbi:MULTISPECIES: AraC family transcriptional regulator [Myxococcus]|uniref:Helix-turn-helix domain-containing protein n=1 Tax=Myxococcus llanfairpwllgwyngyllgogerychwyrndrobwllllantysiliogogogochensis TaxID=2590453 RepID=A0A540X6J7_9BACT|nr:MULTISPECIES: AraC family transcriptional regulator [Myxococcus]NTX04565.1 helix-turn-helix transcriptional regulator [Myxococcus sp. CA040A]TQF16838.1 helix-turn-helix domain-containing protein [Myxococcus llanfairpwllgwyngyllgogerychwyrndrobwllllantysiliogogogochensis]